MKLNKIRHQFNLSDQKLLALLIVFAVLYTLFRYIILGPVSPIHLPSYLCNKTASMLSVLTLAVTANAHHKQHIDGVRYWGTLSLHFLVLHALLSVVLLGQDYYPKFFGEHKMNLKGELIMLSGVLGTYCYWRLSRPSSEFNQTKLKLLQFLAAIFVCIHLFVMGYAGWLTPWKWHGNMPPISLVSFGFAIFALVRFYSGELISKEAQKTI